MRKLLTSSKQLARASAGGQNGLFVLPKDGVVHVQKAAPAPVAAADAISVELSFGRFLQMLSASDSTAIPPASNMALAPSAAAGREGLTDWMSLTTGFCAECGGGGGGSGGGSGGGGGGRVVGFGEDAALPSSSAAQLGATTAALRKFVARICETPCAVTCRYMAVTWRDSVRRE